MSDLATEIKVQNLKDQSAAISDRVQAIAEAIGQLKITLETSEFEYKKARKVLALDNSKQNIKAMESGRETVTRLREDLEKAKILEEALIDESGRLESELKEAERSYALEIIDIVGKKAVTMIPTYNDAIKVAHKALYQLRLVASIAQQYKLEHELRTICPDLPNVSSLTEFPDFRLIESTLSGAPKLLFSSNYDKKAVLESLLTTTNN